MYPLNGGSWLRSRKHEIFDSRSYRISDSSSSEMSFRLARAKDTSHKVFLEEKSPELDKPYNNLQPYGTNLQPIFLRSCL
ncbi:hypothetical protein EBR21_15060 [bacterium]|nr:hypothetical protein [bacterium]